MHRYSWLTLFIGAVLCAEPAVAREYTFDPTTLGGSGNNVDISLFNQGLQLPGVYYVTVVVNGESVDNRNIDFRLARDSHDHKIRSLQPSLTLSDLSRYGIDVQKYPHLLKKNNKQDGDTAASTDQYGDLSAIPQSEVHFDFNQQQLLITVPQQALLPKTEGIAPEVLWDDGVPALLMNYQGNVQRTEYRGMAKNHSDSRYIQLQPGLNFGPWRARSSLSWQQSGADEGRWQTQYLYAE